MGIHRKSLAVIALTLTGIFNSHPTHATEPESSLAQSSLSSSQKEDSLRSATLVYGSDTIDVLRNTYIISIDDHKD